MKHAHKSNGHSPNLGYTFQKGAIFLLLREVLKDKTDSYHKLGGKGYPSERPSIPEIRSASGGFASLFRCPCQTFRGRRQLWQRWNGVIRIREVTDIRSQCCIFT